MINTKLRVLLHGNLLTILIISFITLPVFAESWKGNEIVRDGICHIINPAEGIEPPTAVQLEEQWRIGKESEEDSEIFGLIRDLTVDRDGFVYVMDYQLSELKMFSPDGEFVRTIARKGEGPGELRRPDSICISPGNLVCVVMAYPCRIVKFTREGEHTNTTLMPKDETDSTPIIYDTALAGDHLVVRGGIHDSRYLSAIDDQGNETTRYYEEKHSFDEERPLWEEKSRAMGQRWSVDKDGKIYVASSFYDYRVNVYKHR